MRSWSWVAVLTAVTSVGIPSAADTDTRIMRLGDDVYMAGERLVSNPDSADEVFLAGDRVQLVTAAGGDVLAAGRTVRIEGDVTAGYYESVTRRIGGDITPAGYDVSVPSRDASMEGEVRVTAGKLVSGSEANIGRPLTYWSPEPAVFSESATIAGPVERREALDPWPRGEWPGLWTIAAYTGIGGIVVLIVGGAIPIALFGRFFEQSSEIARRRPGMAFLTGFVGLSALLGSVVVLGLTIIGSVLIPVALLLAPVALLVGYLLGAFSLAERMWQSFGNPIAEKWHIRTLLLSAGISAGSSS